MSTPQVQLAYAPRGVGLAYAVVYLKKDPDICGWWIGAIGADVASAYFRLENFYTRAGTALYTTDGSDLYGGWRFNLTSGQSLPIDRIAVESDLAHELEQAQDAFAAEWLVFETDRDADREAQAYRDAELSHGCSRSYDPFFQSRLHGPAPTGAHYLAPANPCTGNICCPLQNTSPF